MFLKGRQAILDVSEDINKQPRASRRQEQKEEFEGCVCLASACVVQALRASLRRTAW